MHLPNGFSLLELSIVLVIIGLLAGGVMVGQDLVRQAEVRKVTEEYMKFRTATYAFKNKYSAFPGDMQNATAYWGKDDAACTGHTGVAAVPGTCNGNGNGSITKPATGNATGEIFQFWKQLALAGFIEGTYTGLSGVDLDAAILGVNVPNSAINGAGWGLDIAGLVAGASFLALDYSRQRYTFGANTNNDLPMNAALRPSEAYSIDMKIDDGRPGRGHVNITQWSTCTTATANTQIDADYRLSNDAIGCGLFFFNIL